MIPDQRCPSCRVPFSVARAEDIPKNWAVLGILQSVQPVPRVRDYSPAPPSAAKAGDGRIQEAASGAPPHDVKLGAYSDARKHVVSAHNPKPPISTSIFKAPAAKPRMRKLPSAALASSARRQSSNPKLPSRKLNPKTRNLHPQSQQRPKTAPDATVSYPHPPQHHNGYIYATAQGRIVKATFELEVIMSPLLLAPGSRLLQAMRAILK